MNRKTEDVSTRLTPDEFAKRSMDARMTATNRALEGEKVRYRSSNNPERFKKFLEDRLTIWDELKDKTFHGKRMYAKTNKILTNLNTE